MLTLKEDIAAIHEDDWNATKLQDILNGLKQDFEAKHADFHKTDDMKPNAQTKFYHYLRWALYGGRPGTTLANIMYLGRDKTLRRLESAEGEFRLLVEKNKASKAL